MRIVLFIIGLLLIVAILILGWIGLVDLESWTNILTIAGLICITAAIWIGMVQRKRIKI